MKIRPIVSGDASRICDGGGGQTTIENPRSGLACTRVLCSWVLVCEQCFLCTCSGALFMNSGWLNIVYQYPGLKMWKHTFHKQKLLPKCKATSNISIHPFSFFSADMKWQKTRFHSRTVLYMCTVHHGLGMGSPIYGADMFSEFANRDWT
jgi:hypothetical protein